MLITRSLIFTILLLGLSFGSAFSAEKKKSSSLKDLFKTADNTVVFITAGGEIQGSGVSIKNMNVLSPGLAGTIIITNAHVVGNYKKVSIKTNKKTEFIGTVTSVDNVSDLALVQIEGIKLQTASLVSNDKKLEVGDNVFAIGSPKGMSNSLSEGIISGLRGNEGISVIQTTSAISKGSSGGGLFDRKGNLIGITTFKIVDGENVNFAVHIKHIIGLLNKQNKTTSITSNKTYTKKDEGENIKILSKLHPDWQAIATSEDFEMWKLQLTEEERKKIVKNWDPYDVANMVTLYKLYKEGKDYFRKKQYNLAISEYDKAISFNPNNAIAYYERGMTFLELNQVERAIADFDNAIKLNTNNALFYSNRAFANTNMKRYDLAIADHKQTIRILPNSPFAYDDSGKLYNQLKEYDKAVQMYNQAIKIMPNNALFYVNRGLAYTELELSDRSISDYDTAIQLNPGFAPAYNFRGILYLKKLDNVKGCADAKKACDLGLCNFYEFAQEKKFCN